ncbi:MAG: flagellar biosynthesis protein FlhF, partial [Planctomycetota bacterium]
MKLKTYQAWTMSEALAFVKKDLGADAVILHTRTFERGGFFGFGRKAVVEITAARAADMPKADHVRGEGEKADTATSERRGGPRGFKTATLAAPSSPIASTSNASNGSAAMSASLDARAAKNEVVQLSAAARAYGAAPQSGHASQSGQAGSTGFTRGDSANGGSASGTRGHTNFHTSLHTSLNTGLNTGIPLDMDAEREKTRRLAQAMAIQLEKQTSERANAARNERATGAAVRASESAARATNAFGTPSPVRIASPETGVVTTEPVGPAQRFVLVPEVRTIGAQRGDERTMVARVQALAVPAPQMVPSSSVSAAATSESVAAPHAVVVNASMVNADINANTANVFRHVAQSPQSPQSRATDLAEPTPSSDRRELDTISAFVG